MKKVIWFVLGFALATLVYFALVYVFGIFAENFGFILYESESDQQRNFNIVISLWIILSSVAGFIMSSRKS
jgi:hypothetical protein